jgi:hypothetical protein
MPFGTRRSCLMKKTGDEKSRDTVPLNTVKNNYYRWDFTGKVLFSKVINWVFIEEKNRGKNDFPFP